MQGNKCGFLVKTIKKFPKSPLFGQPEVFSLLTRAKFPVPAVLCLNKHKTQLRFNMIENLLCLGFMSLYVCFFLCVILKKSLIFTPKELRRNCSPIGHNNTKHFLCPIKSQHPLEFLEIVRWESVPRGSFARTWKLSFRLFPFLPTRLTAPGSPRMVFTTHRKKMISNSSLQKFSFHGPYVWMINNCWTRMSKISWFVCGEQINYLPKPKVWFARHWQLTIFCDYRVQ